MADVRKQKKENGGREAKQNRKVVPYRRVSRFPQGLNIGTILFGLFFIYMVIILIVFLTRDHVTAYEVVSGTLSGDYRYHALSLRSEDVVKASESGTVTYYAREGAKANSGMLICSVSAAPVSGAAASYSVQNSGKTRSSSVAGLGAGDAAGQDSLAENGADAAAADATAGTASDGTAAAGTASDGTAASGTASDDAVASGTGTDGTAAAGTASDGTAAAGTAGTGADDTLSDAAAGDVSDSAKTNASGGDASGAAKTDGESGSASGTLSEEDSAEILTSLSSFTASWSDEDFAQVYDLKADIKGLILQSSIDENAGTYISGSYQAPESGFVLYQVDGYEGLEENQLTADLFDSQSYVRDSLRSHTSVSAGDSVYKLVTSDSWSLYFPLDATLKTRLEGQDTIRVRFLKDSNTFTAGFSIVEGKDGSYGKVSMTSSLVRYVSDRFLDIEIVLNQAEGLKIPTSAIASREFYSLPADYVTVNSSTQKEISFQKRTFRSDGSEETKTVTANVYAMDKESDSYMVDATLLEDGDYIIMPGTNKKFQITDEAKTTIQGVYNINKGYAVFREVTIIDQNEEYCIVDPGSIYGLAAHDRIALNAAQVTEDQITV